MKRFRSLVFLAMVLVSLAARGAVVSLQTLDQQLHRFLHDSAFAVTGFLMLDYKLILGTPVKYYHVSHVRIGQTQKEVDGVIALFDLVRDDGKNIPVALLFDADSGKVLSALPAIAVPVAHDEAQPCLPYEFISMSHFQIQYWNPEGANNSFQTEVDLVSRSKLVEVSSPQFAGARWHVTIQLSPGSTRFEGEVMTFTAWQASAYFSDYVHALRESLAAEPVQNVSRVRVWNTYEFLLYAPASPRAEVAFAPSQCMEIKK